MVIGVIGGSGLYDWNSGATGLGESKSVTLSTPFGEPSGPYIRQTVGKNEIIFLARHGAGHRLLPSEVNYRANVFGFKKLGATTLISVSAVGSLQEEYAPGHFAFPDQYIDLTKGIRPNTFFGSGMVGHLDFAEPCSEELRRSLIEVAQSNKLKVHKKGTYVCIEGPTFSTRAESNLYRQWGASLIGMTALPEARLAREAGMAYQTVALVTDYDCWKVEEEPVSLATVLAVLQKNVANARELVLQFAKQTLPDFGAFYRGKTRNAVATPPEKWPPKAREIFETLIS